jgi:catechol 2,3-dioxygenase-like lactoylglutathione lyase family enzyme
MADGAMIGAVVIFVRDLDLSVSFYQDILALEVTDRSSTAALLTSAAGAQLLLRAVGGNAAHALGGIGVQYAVWTAASQAEFDQCERALRRRSAYRYKRLGDGISALEGRDPDDIVVMILHPGPDQFPMHKVPVRIYAW